MKLYTLIIFCLLLAFQNTTLAQNMYMPSTTEIQQAPDWAKEMYAETPNLWTVDSLYKCFYRSHAFEKTYHTQYYKRWHKQAIYYTNDQGYVNVPKKATNPKKSNPLARSGSRASWSLAGPIQTWENGTTFGNEQTNVYCVDQCAANPMVMYAGTEPGEVYKSTDGGISWINVSLNYRLGGGTPIWDSGINAIEVDPSNPNIVFSGSGQTIHKSTDGGTTWDLKLIEPDLGVNELLVQPGSPSNIFAATNKGLYQSTDGGNTWANVYTTPCYDIKVNPAVATTLYMVKHNSSLEKAEFFISTNSGVTWNISASGWYNSTDPDRHDGGARIAVTPANPNRIYVYLIGEAKLNDYGFIGVYRSDDAGATWILPNGPDGGPYTSTHLNLAYGQPSWTYHQGFYNCAIMASTTNADEILVGGLNMYKSTDGGTTFTPVCGYVGGTLSMHVDMQDFRAFAGSYWVTTDGGIYKSTDFFSTQPTIHNNGIHGSDFWGFGSGWNTDVLVGGLYHNGNIAYHENYGLGNFRTLGGGEAPTGYVNPGNNTKSSFSDIGGVNLPNTLGGTLTYFGFGMSPNESYYAAESSEMEFHPDCYSTAFIGNENKLWKTDDGGGSFNLLYTFGTSVNDQINYIEISRSNPNVMYLNQQPISGIIGKLWKTTNGGTSWNLLTIPSGNSRRMLLALDYEDSNIIWLAYPDGANGTKIFKSTNGGTSWTNITTSTLDDESVQSIAAVAATNGGVYYCTNLTVYYRNNTMPDWINNNTGLPTFYNSNIARPFYRDDKMRIASYGKGIWESPLEETPSHPIAKASVDKITQNIVCATDSSRFEDLSVLNHTGASWSWTFAGGVPATSTLRNPVVYFASAGNHMCVLTVTDASMQTSSDTIYVNITATTPSFTVNEDFQSIFLPLGWELDNQDNGAQWTLTTSTGGFGTSTQCSKFDNFNNDSQGTYDDMKFKVNLTGATSPKLFFDVAYARYDATYSDTLEVLVSLDCGNTYTSLYTKGGTTLATAPDNTNEFTPTATQWRRDSVDLNSYAGSTELLIAFRNIGRYGNVIYVDNINLSNPVSTNNQLVQTHDFYIFPNPIKSGNTCSVNDPDNNIISIAIFAANGKLIKEFKNKADFNTSNLASGTYLIRLYSATKIKNQLLAIH